MDALSQVSITIAANKGTKPSWSWATGHGSIESFNCFYCAARAVSFSINRVFLFVFFISYLVLVVFLFQLPSDIAC